MIYLPTRSSIRRDCEDAGKAEGLTVWGPPGHINLTFISTQRSASDFHYQEELIWGFGFWFGVGIFINFGLAGT